METYRVKATVSSDGTVTIGGLPLRVGEQVEIVVRSHEPSGEYPLRGTPIRYTDPFGSVAEDDWDATR
jgi:hypothetical protein